MSDQDFVIVYDRKRSMSEREIIKFFGHTYDIGSFEDMNGTYTGPKGTPYNEEGFNLKLALTGRSGLYKMSRSDMKRLGATQNRS